MVKQMKIEAMAMVAMMVILFSCLASGATLVEQCGNAFTKVTACLTFATGKAAVPTKECCSSVTEIKDTNPVCLCYIIQQFYNSSDDQLKSLGVQEARLVQLHSACKVNGGNISDCPKLLNLPPNSPASAIFTNSSIAASSSPVTTPSSPTPIAKSNGFKHAISQLTGAIGSAMVVIFFSAFP